jgi:N-acetylglutamate synthase-like GNAT family acetyltransferase
MGVRPMINIRRAGPQDRVGDLLLKGALREGRDDIVMVVLEDDNLVGCGSLEMEGTLAIMNSIYVTEGKRNEGLGYGLLRSIMYTAMNNGAEWMEVPSEEKSRDFFIKSGFVPAEDCPQVLEINLEAAFNNCCCGGDCGCGEGC